MTAPRPFTPEALAERKMETTMTERDLSDPQQNAYAWVVMGLPKTPEGRAETYPQQLRRQRRENVRRDGARGRGRAHRRDAQAERPAETGRDVLGCRRR